MHILLNALIICKKYTLEIEFDIFFNSAVKSSAVLTWGHVTSQRGQYKQSIMTTN